MSAPFAQPFQSSSFSPPTPYQGTLHVLQQPFPTQGPQLQVQSQPSRPVFAQDTSNKQAIPSPLPTFRGHLAIPPSLLENVISALLHTPGAVQRIQTALRLELKECGFLDAMERNTSRALEQQMNGVKGVDENVVLRGLVEDIRKAVDERESAGADDGDAGLRLGEEVMGRLVGLVGRELEACCVCVDGEEWVE